MPYTFAGTHCVASLWRMPYSIDTGLLAWWMVLTGLDSGYYGDMLGG